MSQALTRDKLLETAKTAFLRDGYASTSLEQIAEAAGYSKGAVYSNFRNKDELCLAVLDAIRADRAAALAKAIGKKTMLADRIAAFQAWAERNIGDRAWTALEVEFGVHAARDRALARALRTRDRRVRANVETLVLANAAGLGVELPMPASDIAIALLSLGVGLGVQRAIDPTLSVRSLSELLRLFAGGALASRPEDR
jgi:AcrR family transcriptional regulator